MIPVNRAYACLKILLVPGSLSVWLLYLFPIRKEIVGYKIQKNLKKISSAAENQMVQITVPITVSKVTPTGILSGTDRINKEVV